MYALSLKSYFIVRITHGVQVTKMLVVSVVVFAICWLPQHVALFINYFILHICPPEFLWFGGTLLAYANSAMNPIIYVAFHSEYTKQFKVALVRCCPICLGLRIAGTGRTDHNIHVGRKVEKCKEKKKKKSYKEDNI